MKIAILMDAPLRKKLISDKAMQMLEGMGTISANETEAMDKETVKKVIAGSDVAVTSWGVPRLDGEILDAAPDLKLVVHAAGSVKGVVSDEMFARGIRITSSARILSEGVSETALGFTICACKNVFALNDSISKGGWKDDSDDIKELYDITIGVVGCGFAGSHYIELLRPFGVDILAYDPGVSKEKLARLGAKKVDLETLLRNSDVVSLHAPSIPSTYHMLNKDTLALMKERAVLINTARGSLIDEAALIETLQSGRLKYACLDVTDPEPPKAENPLRGIANCIMTPHLAGLANNGKLKIGVHVAEEIGRFVRDEALIGEVAEEMLATIA